ncbi:MAG: hypothetical protein R6U29_02200 [Desulfosudaceae bacterium]
MNAQEMTRRIYEDVQDALSLVAERIENPPARIESVNVRVGERSDAMQAIADLDPSPFSSRNGWIIDITFSPRDLSRDDSHTFKTISALPLFSALPVKTIRGVGRIWANRLGAIGLDTIGGLVAAEDSAIAALVNEFDNLFPLACRHKAAQLDSALPLFVVERFGQQDLYTLTRTDPELIAAVCQNKAMNRLTARFLSACAAGIDAAVLASLRLNELFRS